MLPRHSLSTLSLFLVARLLSLLRIHILFLKEFQPGHHHSTSDAQTLSRPRSRSHSNSYSPGSSQPCTSTH
ncbi:hypothetical protein IE53DRAFT_164128 [Violaceomyces palustris]|uniref:Uncharacterized protein n=1 Tax=Violaceomyces palustris TaxID=1673888 RepID=A0ACD0NTA0_9BASI|nr:hypothetical protein IE53DRAFT_164128 [Violaceomyces palustris]